MADRYAVFGNPIAHSKSPQIHMAFAQANAQSLIYEKQLIDESAFESAVVDFFALGGCGLNVTVPFKLRAFAMADVLTARAECAGAVNTLYMQDGKLHGDNTDGVGLLVDIRDYLKWPIKNQRILILGAGGASRGVLLPLLQEKPAEILIVNRTIVKAQALINLFIEKHAASNNNLRLSAGGFEHLNNCAAFDLIINATSASLNAHVLNLPENCYHINTACYDMAYADQATIFLQWAQQQGMKKTADGLGMLLEQAAESFRIWRHVKPSTQMLRDSMRVS